MENVHISPTLGDYDFDRNPIQENPVMEDGNETGLDEVVAIDPEEVARQQFKEQVDFLMMKIGEDPDVRDRIICETYVNIANIETAIRGTFQMFQDQGMASIFKSMFGRGKKVKDAGGSEPESE